MQTRQKNKQKKQVPTEQQRIVEISDDLNVPEFWKRVAWSSWSITTFDKVATRSVLGLNKRKAHDYFSLDAIEVLRVLDENGRQANRVKQMQKDLKFVQ
ncbi:hypothetical protein INT45_013554 [Circinella minor]|uniref:Uncharacterized protein n=1 Tax=Circinella minor TaxID=1195481 RepID=A0A8H7VNG9_9FUNG|nr:hypothetical protein INT45_013554 [Circinella minor]